MNRIGRREVAEALRVRSTGRDLRERHGFERLRHIGQRIALRRRQLRHRANQHFLGAAAAGDQADADFDEAHVGFRRRLHAIAVQRNFRAAAERQAGRRGDDRNGAVAQRHGRLLERADHHVELVPVAFLRLEQDEHQVRAGGEIRRVVADDQRLAALGGFLHAGLQHLDGVAADGVHLRMELDRDDAVAKVDEARAGVLLDDAALFLRRAEDLQVGRGRLDEAVTEARRARLRAGSRSAAGRRPPSHACPPRPRARP